MAAPKASNLVDRKASIVSAAGLASEDDAVVLGKNSTARLVSSRLVTDPSVHLAKLGYKQELRRNFSMVEVFGIAFSIMGLLPSIASTLLYSIPAGPVGMVWVGDFGQIDVILRLT